jgi:hypothetical protein
MACILTNGYTLDCRDNLGGIKGVWVGAYNTTLAYTLGADTQTIGTFSGGTSSFISFEQDLEVAQLSSEFEANSENGTTVYTDNLTIIMPKLTGQQLETLRILGQGKWRVLIQDNNSHYFLLGVDNGVRVTAAPYGSGKALSDLNGVTITFTSRGGKPIFRLTPTAADQLI